PDARNSRTGDRQQTRSSRQRHGHRRDPPPSRHRLTGQAAHRHRRQPPRGRRRDPAARHSATMKHLGDIVLAVRRHHASVEERVAEVRRNPAAAAALLDEGTAIRRSVPWTETPTGLRLPRLALPDLDEAGAVARFLNDEGLPGSFPYLAAAYPELYLDAESGGGRPEEPTRLFAGLGLAEDTNERFRLLTGNQR